MALRSNVVFHFLALALLLFCTDAASVTATPVARVISLLQKLEGQIQKEGSKEAAEYDKYACWCKEQADDTQYAIEKSKKIIEELTAKIEKLDGEIKVLTEEIKELEKTIEEKEAAIKKAVEKREEEHTKYKEQAEDIADGIGACEEAIKVLKDSKKDMKKAKLDLLQGKLLKVLSSVSSSESRLQAVQSLTQPVPPASPAKAHAYEYQSNDIIGTIEKLKAEFKADLKKVNVEEKEKLFEFEELKQSLENERDFAEKDKIEKTSSKEDKESEKAELETDKEKEEKELKDDEGYLEDVTGACQDAATQWDQRSKTRSEELTAISKAIEHLQKGVQGNYGSNTLAAGASFLQLRGRGSLAAVVSRVQTMINAEAKKLHSESLTGLAVKLSTGGHFDSVVKLIEDLIKKLEDEQKAAEEGKTKCDEEMTEAVKKRDTSKQDAEESKAKIALKTAEVKKLSKDIAKLDKEVSELKKALLEATELRAEEKDSNEKTLADAEAGKAAVDDAIAVMQEFYGSFLQKKGPNRHGDSIEDAPKLSYSGDYEGKTEQGTGVIGILEVIADDFQHTIDETKSAEETAQTDFEAFEKDNKQVSEDKEKLKEDKETAKTEAADEITNAKDALEDAEKLMENAMAELEKVTAMCMTGEGTFEERKKQREQEIEALKGAMKILQDWKDL